jgi:sulfite reductase (NADPH) flavoprotein alpha-component
VHDYAQKNLENERFVLVLTSTFGEGNLPDNAQTFHNFLSHANPGFCDNIEFAVCGFGSTDYPKFCEAAKLFDAAFEKLGGTRILDLVECDENSVDRYVSRIAFIQGDGLGILCNQYSWIVCFAIVPPEENQHLKAGLLKYGD